MHIHTSSCLLNSRWLASDWRDLIWLSFSRDTLRTWAICLSRQSLSTLRCSIEKITQYKQYYSLWSECQWWSCPNVKTFLLITYLLQFSFYWAFWPVVSSSLEVHSWVASTPSHAEPASHPVESIPWESEWSCIQMYTLVSSLIWTHILLHSLSMFLASTLECLQLTL